MTERQFRLQNRLGDKLLIKKNDDNGQLIFEVQSRIPAKTSTFHVSDVRIRREIHELTKEASP